MPPKPYEPPDPCGPEEALFASLVTLHVKFIAERHDCFALAMKHGVTRERVTELATLAMRHATPAEWREAFDTTIHMLARLPKPRSVSHSGKIDPKLIAALTEMLKDVHELKTAAVLVLTKDGDRVLLSNVPRPLALAILDSEMRRQGDDELVCDPWEKSS